MHISAIEDPCVRLAVAILRRAYLDAGPHNKSALCFLYEDETAWLMDSIGLDVEATRAHLTRCLMRRTLRRQARRRVDKNVTYVKMVDRDGRPERTA